MELNFRMLCVKYNVNYNLICFQSRAMILDVMMTSSDSSPTSSCGGSVSSESTDDPSDYSHLHRIHRFNRQKKGISEFFSTPSN